MRAESNAVHNYVIVSFNKMLYKIPFRNIEMDKKKKRKTKRKVILHELALIHTGGI